MRTFMRAISFFALVLLILSLWPYHVHWGNIPASGIGLVVLMLILLAAIGVV